MIKPDLRTYDDIKGLSRACSHLLSEILASAQSGARIATFVLAGGETPRDVYRLLAGEPTRRSVDWSRVHFYWGDERCVPPHSPDSNFGMADDALLSKVGAPASHVHRIQGELADPEKAALLYEEEIEGNFPDSLTPAFDVVLLGLGEDGHTASLFPGAHWDEDRLVVPALSPHFPAGRVSMTPKLLNTAHHVVFLVAGSRKAPALAKVIEDPSTPYPAARIKPVSGHLTWMVDRAAASLLREGE